MRGQVEKKPKWVDSQLGSWTWKGFDNTLLNFEKTKQAFGKNSMVGK